MFSETSGVPVDDMIYSDFIIGGRWDGVDGVLRGVYQEASENLGREFVYPADQED
jgi:ribonuclease Z